MRAPFQVLVVPFRRRAGAFEVLVLQRADFGIWQFVSGGGESGETPEVAARREAIEEASLPTGAALVTLDAIASVPACWFEAWASWSPELLVVREYAFAIHVEDDAPIVLSAEHSAMRWVRFDDAVTLLRFDSNRVALWELHERLYPGPRVKRAAFDRRHTGVCPCSPQTS